MHRLPVLLALLLMGCRSADARQGHVLVKEATAVSIVCIDLEHGTVAHASGFAVAEDLLVTCSHSLPNDALVIVTLPDGGRVGTAGVVARDADSDLVLIRLREPLPPLPMGGARCAQG